MRDAAGFYPARKLFGRKTAAADRRADFFGRFVIHVGSIDRRLFDVTAVGDDLQFYPAPRESLFAAEGQRNAAAEKPLVARITLRKGRDSSLVYRSEGLGTAAVNLRKSGFKRGSERLNRDRGLDFAEINNP